jgi:hydrophobic/amphiphilic exporter-1 (mainly G- bacteria), HAE1 family
MFNIFIKRPVMAIVLSLAFLFMGVLAIRTLPIAQFPDIAPPRVTVNLSFPGSSADVLVKSSLIMIERAINGVPGMKYLTSDATSAGESTIQVYFNLGVDPNIAMVNVKTRVDQMMSRLPKLVQLEGVIVNFVQPSMLMYVNLYSKDKNADQKLLFNSCTARTKTPIRSFYLIMPTSVLFRKFSASPASPRQPYWAPANMQCGFG